ncbi:MAG: hypothetical protein AB8G99_05995 [Planctomycetaceae bacterium]
MTCIIAGAAVFFIWPHLENVVARPFKRWVMLGLGVVCLLPQILAEMYFPPAIDITAYSDKVEYEFSDRDYAVEFACLNEDAAFMQID